jgi:O-antigen/teichoic acid export membrane protein
MVFRHSLIYAVARGGPALVNFLGLLLFARLLAPEEYGRYALVMAGVGLANATCFWWLQYGLLRFLPAYRDRRESLLSAIATGYGGAVLATLPLLGALLLVPGLSVPRGLLLLGAVLLWVQSWHEVNLELTRSDLRPGRYGVLLATRALLMVSVGGALAYAGWGAAGVLAGGIAAAIVPSLAVLRANWRGVHPGRAHAETLRKVLRYALPLTATSAMMLIVGSFDRFFLEWLGSRHAVGVYAAGYDLAQFTLGMLMNVVYLAAFPLALRALESDGPDAARAHLATGFAAMLAVGAPGAAGLALLAGPVAAELLGPEFAGAAAIIPWIAAGTFLGSMKAFYFDLSFQVGHATRTQLGVAFATVAASVAGNLLLIPVWGARGAAVSAVVALGGGMVLSAVLGRRVFRLPLPLYDVARVGTATAAMALVLAATRGASGLPALGGRIVLGAAVYAAAAVALNLLGSRDRLAARLRGRRLDAPAAALHTQPNPARPSGHPTESVP